MRLLVNDVQAWQQMSVYDESMGDAREERLGILLFLNRHCIVGRVGSLRDDAEAR